MTAADITPGYSLAFVQECATQAITLYQADPVANREAFDNALGFLQKLTAVDLKAVRKGLHATKMTIDEAMTRAKPELRASLKAQGKIVAVAGKNVSAVDVPAIVALTRLLFGLMELTGER